MKCSSCFLVVVLGLISFAGCKKTDTDNPADPDTALAATLRASCTAPFAGEGDSSDVWLPTAFSPNGDGINDVYWPIKLANSTNGYFSTFTMKVYDTMANLVYQTTNASDPRWEGLDPTTNAISNKYKYYVTVKYTTAHGVSDSGSTYVYLLRGVGCIPLIAADTARYRFPGQFDPRTGYSASWTPNETYCP